MYYFIALLSGIKWNTLTTTCYFHVGGFITPLQIVAEAKGFIFNHGSDIDGSKTLETVYQEIDMFKPLYLLCGSHHLVQLSQQDPKDKTLETRFAFLTSTAV